MELTKRYSHLMVVGAIMLTAIIVPVRASTFVETVDAGDRPASAIPLPPGTTDVAATTKPGVDDAFGANPMDVDVFAFTVRQPVNAQIFVRATEATLDPNLLLLREGFFGLAGDDDGALSGPSDYDSLITITLAPGTYYAAAGTNNIGAFAAGATAAGDSVWDNDSGLLNPPASTTPIVFVGAKNGSPTTGQAYTLNLNFPVSVTGLDLSAGASAKALAGVDVLNATAKGQTARIRGRSSASFTLSLTNSGGDRRIKVAPVKKSGKYTFTARSSGPSGSKTITNLLRKGNYVTNVPHFASETIKITVRSTGPLRNQKFLVRATDLSGWAASDTAGALVSLKP